MQSNDPKLGLLSNNSNQKYSDSPQENDGVELLEFGDDSDQIQFDDTICQNKAVVLTNLDQNPITMASSKPKENQIQQVNQKIQSQASHPLLQQVPQSQVQNVQNLSNQNGFQTFSREEREQPNQISQNRNQNVNTINQTQSICMFCQVPQMIPKDKNVFICYNCKQINKLIFAYFICGTCRLTVVYQQGISNLINCTNCMTMNYVQQPNLPNTHQQAKPSTLQVQYLVHQPLPQSTLPNQQQGQGTQQQQQRNQVSDLEAEFKDLIN